MKNYMTLTFLTTLILMSATAAKAEVAPPLECLYTRYTDATEKQIAFQTNGTWTNATQHRKLAFNHSGKNYGSVFILNLGKDWVEIASTTDYQHGIIKSGESIEFHSINFPQQEPKYYTLTCKLKYAPQDIEKAFQNFASQYPTPTGRINSSKSENHWFIGNTNFAFATTRVVELHTDQMHKLPTEVVKGYAAFRDESKMIVAIEVLSNWHDGTNGHWQIMEGGLGQQFSTIQLTSRMGRGQSFTVRYYYVDCVSWHDIFQPYL